MSMTMIKQSDLAPMVYENLRRPYMERHPEKLAITVLIVDNSPMIVTRLTELLEDVTAITSLKTCGTYGHAVRYFETYQPKIALLDINLPDKSGIELLKYVKFQAPETKVIMLTNQSGDYYREQCLKMGADYFLDKSLDFDRIPFILTSLT